MILPPHGLQGSCSWDSPGKNTGGGCHFLYQGIFQTQGLNLRLLHWQATLPLSHLGSLMLYYVCQNLFHDFSSVQFSPSVVYNSLWPHGLQHARLPCPSPTPRTYSNSCPLSRWSHRTISSSVVPFSSCLQSFLASRSFQWVSSLHQVAKGLEFQPQHQSFQWIFRTDFLYDGLFGSPCCSRDSQESSPTPQFKSINSSMLSFLYRTTLISIHDYWKNHSFD